jgi:hypothetical protein
MNAKSILTTIGSLMVLCGIASAILSFFGYNLRLLLWIDSWGLVAGWIIRIALIVVGGVIFFIGKKRA